MMRKISVGPFAAGILAGLMVASLVAPSHVAAYDPSAAVSWAESRWNSCGYGTTYPCISANDCTAFVSSALHKGGYNLHGPDAAHTNTDLTWWKEWVPMYGWFIWSNTWGVANELRDFLLKDSPGGTSKLWTSGTTTLADSGGSNGDVIFYDWNPSVPDGGGEPFDHVSIITGYGTPSSGSGYGDLVTQHTTNRKDVYWTLRTWNVNIQTTKINSIHVSANN